jgi:hypothetical protein
MDFIIPINPTDRLSKINDAIAAIDKLSNKHAWQVEISKRNTRLNICNRLMWAWHRQYAKFMGYSSENYSHGEIKLDILLPVKLSSDEPAVRKRGEWEAFILSHVPDREHKVGAAFDQVRSNDLPPDTFSEFLTAYKQYGNEQGCILQSRKDLEDIALMNAYESEAV